MKRLSLALIAGLFISVVTPNSVEAKKPVCDPDKRRNARVLTQSEVPTGADFSGSDLRCGSYGSIKFVDVNFRGAKLDGAEFGMFVNVVADNASLKKSRIRNRVGLASPQWSSGSFRNADLSGANIFIGGIASVFDGANFTGAQVHIFSNSNHSFVKANFTGAKIRTNTGVSGSFGNFTGAKMRNLRTSRLSLVNSILVRVDFSGSRLQGADFSGSDLSKANFSNTNIQNAKFYDAIVVGANFKGAKGKAFGLSK